MKSKERVEEIINLKHENSGGHCGTYIQIIMLEVGLSLEEINPILRELYDAKLIRTRKGMNGVLIFKNAKRHERI